MIYIDLPQHVNDMVFSTSRQTPLVVGQAVKMWGISTTGYNWSNQDKDKWTFTYV